MHSIDPFANRPASRSKLGATLLQLRRHIDGNRQREQAAMELFQTWQARWSDHRDLIARHLECLDRELAQLTFAAVPAPHLSLLALSARSEEDSENAGDISQDTADSMQDNEEQNGIIPSPHARWHET